MHWLSTLHKTDFPVEYIYIANKVILIFLQPEKPWAVMEDKWGKRLKASGLGAYKGSLARRRSPSWASLNWPGINLYKITGNCCLKSK